MIVVLIFSVCFELAGFFVLSRTEERDRICSCAFFSLTLGRFCVATRRDLQISSAEDHTLPPGFCSGCFNLKIL